MLRVSVVGLGLAVEPRARSLLDLADRVEVTWAASPSARRTEAFSARYRFPVTNEVEAAIRPSMRQNPLIPAFVGMSG